MRIPLICLALTFMLLPCLAATEPKGDVKRGKVVFEQNQCSLCHTNGGNNLNPERPIKGPKFLARVPDDKVLAAMIRKGTSTGMPSFGTDKLSEQNLADVMAYVRSLSQPAAKPKKKK